MSKNNTKKKDSKQQDEKEFQVLLTPLDEDVPYEEEVHRNPYNIRSWIRYLEYKEEASPALRNVLHERALRELPGSYKLWFNYLHERRIQVRGLPLNDPAYDSVNEAFERCLQTLHKMPRIWLEYGEFLITQKKVTKTRHVFDRALRALPITQHDRVWKLYSKFASGPYVPFTTSHKIWARYLKVEPDRVEEYAQYLKSTEQWNEAVVQLIKIVNNDNFSAQTKHDNWMSLCEIIAKYSEKLHNNNIDVDKIVRGGLKQFSEDTGKMWTTLAGYYIRQSLFDKARDIFEEGMDTVVTVKDFSQIWDAYAKFEDGLIAAQVETMDKQEDPEELIDFDLRIARYENLLARQPLLVNSVLLRQNPHNVHEWQKRAALYKGNNRMIVETYSQALSTVDPMKALGKPYFLWIEFAHFYESLGDLEKARKVFEQGTQAPFKTIDDLATVWCAYAEFEIRQNNYVGARNLLQTATTVPRSVKAILSSEREPVQKKVYRSTKLWALYVDLEESVGTFANTKAVYERILELKVASPQIVINFAHFLEEHKYYEESFKAYEKGISLFKFPHSLDIWVAYLIKFVARYGGKKLERARDLFEQVLSEAPAKDSKIFYIMYANLEEEFGLARHAMSVYDRATRTVAEEDRFAIFSLYINRASEFFGVTRTRDIYEQAISLLPDQHAKVMAMRYADLERKLGEIDRARAIFIHSSQFSDPRTDAQYWMKWREFEVEHGNQDTFREMLRIKRSVQAQLNTSVNVMAAQMLSDKEKEVTKAARPALPPSDMEILERAANLANKERLASEQAAKLHNPEEISVEDEDEEENQIEEPEDVVEEKSVPQAIFERNVPTTATSENKQPLGALARLKRKQDQ